MKQFIKFTKPLLFESPLEAWRAFDEIIVEQEAIESMSANKDRYFASFIQTVNNTNEQARFDIEISKEDYENASRILLENDQSITPTDGNDAGPAIETLENDADPATKEKELLKRVMEEFNNNIVGASMRLGMSVNVLRRKLKSYGLPCK